MPVVGLRPPFSSEFRERAIERVIAHQAAYGGSLRASTEFVGGEVGCSGAILRRWFKERERSQQAGRSYGIKELLAEFDVSSRTLRFYEEEGLVRPARRGPTRIYSEGDRETIARIVDLRRLGFSIAEIQTNGLDIGTDAGKLAAKQAELRDQREALELTLRQLEIRLTGLANRTD